MNELPKFESGPEKEGAVEQVEGKKEARQEFDEVSVSDKKEKNPATPEVTREEAFNLYKESIYLFNELKILAGLEKIPTDQKSLESWFNKGLENSRGNLSVYVSSTKERIADIKKQIEDLKRKGAGPDREITKDKGGELALGIGSESSPKIDTVGAGAKDGVEGSEVVGSFGLSEKVESSQGAGVDMSGSKIEDQNKEKELEEKKREAYGFYIEFTTLLAELNQMSGDPKIATDQKSLDDGFDNDVQGLDEGDWDGYISDLKKRIADIQTQIEINKRNLIDERKRKKVGVGGGDDVTVKLDESLDIGEINTDLENQRSLEEAVRPKNDHAKEEAEILNAQLKRELDSLLNRLNRVKNIRFVNKDGEEGQMSSRSAVRNIENFIKKYEADTSEGNPKPEEVESFLSGFRGEGRLYDDLFLYFLNKRWLRYDEKDSRILPLEEGKKKIKADLFVSFCRFWKESGEEWNLKEPLRVGDVVAADGLDDMFDRFGHGDEFTKLDLWRAGIWEPVQIEDRLGYKIVDLPDGVEALWGDKKEGSEGVRSGFEIIRRDALNREDIPLKEVEDEVVPIPVQKDNDSKGGRGNGPTIDVESEVISESVSPGEKITRPDTGGDFIQEKIDPRAEINHGREKDERVSLYLKLFFEDEDVKLNSDEVDYDRLDNGTEKYWVALRNCIKRYFVAPSLERVEKDSILVLALTRLVLLHSNVPDRSPFLTDFKRVQDFTDLRKKMLDDVKLGDQTFADFAIEKNDLEQIFKNAKHLLDRKISLARRLKEEGVETADVDVEGGVGAGHDDLPEGREDSDESMILDTTGVPMPEDEEVPGPEAGGGDKTIEKSDSTKALDKPASPISRRETPDWSGGTGFMSIEEARAGTDRILGERRATTLGGRPVETSSAPSSERRPATPLPTPTAERGPVPPVPPGERPPVRPEAETEEESGPETVVVRRGGVLHDWRKKTLQVLTLGGLLFGLNSWLTKKEDDGNKDTKPDSGSAKDRIEHVEKEKTPLQKLEGSLTNFVSPQYLEKIKALDKVEAVSGNPLMTGFERIKPDLEKDLEFIWNDKNGFYPKGWISGKFSTINFSDGTYDDVETPDTVKEPGTKKNIGTHDENIRSIHFYVNGTNQLSTLVTNRESMYKFVNGLDKTFAHEVGHASDWTGNWAYPSSKSEGEMADLEKKDGKNPDFKYEKRLTLLGNVLSRLESANRLHFKAVEDIPESQRELRAGEYWASICDTYFEFPERMEKENKEDFDLVNGVVQDMDPGFNPKAAKNARYEVISNLGKENVTLLAGGKVTTEEFRKKVVEGLKGIGGKPRYFNAYTQTEK
jgi:hypothetical protein